MKFQPGAIVSAFAIACFHTTSCLVFGIEPRISDMGGTGDPEYIGWKPAIAYNSTDNQFLVVWSGEDNDAGLVDGEREIFGQLLDASTGLEIGENDFRISDMGGTGNPTYDAWESAVAYNSANNEYLVVWKGDDNIVTADDEYEIFGQRLSATGVEIGANDFRISDMGPDGNPSFGPDWGVSVAYNSTDNQYLVVWNSNDHGGGLHDSDLEIFGQLLDAGTGAEVGVNDFRMSDVGGIGVPSQYGAYYPSVAYNSANNEYLVVWSGDDNVGGLLQGEYEIFSQRLSSTGVEEGANDFRISDMGGIGEFTYVGGSPSVAYNDTDNHYLVVWHGDDNVGGLVDDEFEIFGQLLDAATGAETGINDFRISDMGDDPVYDAQMPRVVYNSGAADDYLVVWSGDDNTSGLADEEWEIFGQFVAADGAQIGDNDFRISSAGGTGDPAFDAYFSSVAYSSANGGHVVVWQADDNVGGLVDEEFEIFGRALVAPLPFAKVSPANGAGGQPRDLVLTWGASSNAASYEYCIDIAVNGVCDGAWVSVGSSTSASITDLDYETTYSWQVRAVNSAGSTEADDGVWWQFNTEDLPLPGAFGKAAPVNGAGGQPTDSTLSWDEATDATSYEYCVDTSVNDTCDTLWHAIGPVLSVELHGLLEGTAYSWQVKAVNSSGSTAADDGAWWWFVTTPYLFADGFEPGDTSAWSATVP